MKTHRVLVGVAKGAEMSATRMLTRVRSSERLRRVLLVGLAGGAIAATCIVGVAAVTASVPSVGLPGALTPSDGAREQSDGWIAYSTAPANGQWDRRGGDGNLPYLQGSDVYLARAGSEPRLVAGRGDGTTWNVCPAFSPDGTMLAFGTRSPKRRAVRVVGVTQAGAIVAPSIRLALEGRGGAPCPRWSADGSRLAYLEGRRVVVRGLDGSLPRRRAGDPSVGDFGRSDSMLVSPIGDRVARLACDHFDPTVGGVVVTRIDGSEPRDLGVECFGTYALAAWSPDGQKILVMKDVSGFHFAMLAVSVNAPHDVVSIVSARVNHPRSWPGHGDVSWQPSAAS